MASITLWWIIIQCLLEKNKRERKLNSFNVIKWLPNCASHILYSFDHNELYATLSHILSVSSVIFGWLCRSLGCTCNCNDWHLSNSRRVNWPFLDVSATYVTESVQAKTSTTSIPMAHCRTNKKKRTSNWNNNYCRAKYLAGAETPTLPSLIPDEPPTHADVSHQRHPQTPPPKNANQDKDLFKWRDSLYMLHLAVLLPPSLHNAHFKPGNSFFLFIFLGHIWLSAASKTCTHYAGNRRL